MTVAVKICGLQNEETLRAAIDGGAAMVGFVFFSKSKNVVTTDTAKMLAALVPPSVQKVGLFVDAADNELRDVLAKVPLDLLQLHGEESVERVAQIRKMTGVKVMKALRLKTPQQFRSVPPYEAVADRLLFDSRIGNEESGGPLDWSIFKGKIFSKPWMLAGGLNAENLADAVQQSGAIAVDVSSGVEDAPNHKSVEKIRAFLQVAAGL